jgi:adenosylmethionine-8-amino-7-oxononanoate aminotransferase
MTTAESARQVVATARQLGLLVRQQGRAVMAVPPLILDCQGAEAIVRLLRQAILTVPTTVDVPSGRSAMR